MATKKEHELAGVSAESSGAVTEAASHGMIVLSDQVPEYLRDGSGRGSEGVQAEDMLVPRIEIVQSLSPIRDKNDPQYVQGAEEGMIFNTVTQELYGEKVFVVPVFFRTQYLVWIDRKSGGGFRGSYSDKSEAEAVATEESVPAEAVPTAEHFVLLVPTDGGDTQQCMVSMARSKMKISRRWNSTISMMGGDRWSRVYELSSVAERNSQGQLYYNWKIRPIGFPGPTVATRAEDLYNKIFTGSVVLRTEPEDDAAPAEAMDTNTSKF